MIWFLLLLIPLFLFGFIVDYRKKKRINTNHDAYKPNGSNTDHRAHHSMGENIRGGGGGEL
ncbi:hypothetical protein LG329_15305 [Virgibacillus necropolis]|uniref:hypothetical protein n=1 Tax=Virgibacillus necropolis TaxID=163877 RepID=UPI00384EBD07